MDLTVARKKMIDCQIRPNDVTDERLISAFHKVPRETFLPKAMAGIAYSEVELETSSGRKLWLARDLAKLLQALEVDDSDLVLVIGAGEGYSASLLNELGDTVIALENDQDVVDAGADLMLSLNMDRVAFVSGDLAKGYPDEGPYDVVFVNGMVEYVPEAWLEQLAPGGRLGVVVGDNRNGEARVYTRSETSTSYKAYFDCVPPTLNGFRAEAGFVF